MVRWLLNPWLGTNLPFFTLYLAVIFAAWSGGLKPGLLSVALGFVEGVVAFADPAFVLPTGDLIDFLDRMRFVVVGVCVSVICEALHRQRRRAEAQTELMRVTLAGIGDAVITTDSGSRITFMNPAAEAMTGFAFDEVRGRVLHDVVHHHRPDGSAYPMVECPIHRALLEHANLVKHEDVFLRKDGALFPVLVNTEPIYRDDRAAGIVIEVRDITEQKQAAEALRDAKTAARTSFRQSCRTNSATRWPRSGIHSNCRSGRAATPP